MDKLERRDFLKALACSAVAAGAALPVGLSQEADFIVGIDPAGPGGDWTAVWITSTPRAGRDFMYEAWLQSPYADPDMPKPPIWERIETS